MRQIKRIFIIMIMAAFTMNAVAASAMAICNCEEMTQASKQEMTEKMPCHGMDDSEKQAADQTSDDEDSKQANCGKCGCGHCKVPSQMSILGGTSPSTVVTSSTLQLPATDIVLSGIVFGIDYPPKPIS